MSKLHYYQNCVGWPRGDVEDGLMALVDSSHTISRRTFLRKVDRQDLSNIETGLGYAPPTCRRTGALQINEDYHVRYAAGTLHGRPAAFLVHSAIEYVFWNGEQSAER